MPRQSTSLRTFLICLRTQIKKTCTHTYAYLYLLCIIKIHNTLTQADVVVCVRVQYNIYVCMCKMKFLYSLRCLLTRCALDRGIFCMPKCIKDAALNAHKHKHLKIGSSAGRRDGFSSRGEAFSCSFN